MLMLSACALRGVDGSLRDMYFARQHQIVCVPVLWVYLLPRTSSLLTYTKSSLWSPPWSPFIPRAFSFSPVTAGPHGRVSKPQGLSG